jgi:hypothetical protein
MLSVRNPELVAVALTALGLSACGSNESPHSAGNPGLTGTTQVLTQRNDIARSGLNLEETVLSTENVQHDRFGKLFTRQVDDELYAQLLIATNVAITGKGAHDVVIAATVNDSVYAFDANDPAQTQPLWFINLVPPGARPTQASDMTDACGGTYHDFSGNIGIVSTPVVDRQSDTVYVVTRTFEDGQQVHRLHALALADGSEQPNSPVVIGGAVPGTGDGSAGGTLAFEGLHHNQRAALLLLGGVIYIAWAGHCDWPPYHGWIMGYDAATLEQKILYSITPDGAAGGVWQSGQGLASDGTYVFAVSGNGTIGQPDDPTSTRNRGQSFLKLLPSGSTLSVESWFTPYNYQYLEQKDLDLGSAGLLLIPGTHLGVAGGKGGRLYVVDLDAMGGLSTSTDHDDNVIQSFDVNVNHIHGTPLYWDGPDGGRVFVWGEEDYLKSYPFLGASYTPGTTVLDTDNMTHSTMTAPTGAGGVILMPGGFLSLSADAQRPGSAVLWASLPFSGDANSEVRPGILRAFDAGDVTHELWNNRDDDARDSCGDFAKFAVTTIANGKVYLGSFSNQFCVYGLLDQAP